MNKILLGMAAAALLVSGTANATLIDDFTSGAQSIVLPVIPAGTITLSDTVVAATALGGSRTLDLTITTPDATSNPPSGSSTVTTGAGGLYAQDAGTGITTDATITWNGGSVFSGMNGGAGLALDGSGFIIDIASIDFGNVPLTLTVTDASSASAFVTDAGATLGNNYYAFSGFAGVDFSAITFIDLNLKGATASDISITSIKTVPEPSVLALFGLGLLGLGLARRRVKS